jgi:hypothetical protein
MAPWGVCLVTPGGRVSPRSLAFLLPLLIPRSTRALMRRSAVATVAAAVQASRTPRRSHGSTRTWRSRRSLASLSAMSAAPSSRWSTMSWRGSTSCWQQKPHRCTGGTGCEVPPAGWALSLLRPLFRSLPSGFVACPAIWCPASQVRNQLTLFRCPEAHFFFGGHEGVMHQVLFSCLHL